MMAAHGFASWVIAAFTPKRLAALLVLVGLWVATVLMVIAITSRGEKSNVKAQEKQLKDEREQHENEVESLLDSIAAINIRIESEMQLIAESKKRTSTIRKNEKNRIRIHAGDSIAIVNELQHISAIISE